MGAAIDDVHHGNGEHARLRAADVTIKRQRSRFGGRLRYCEGHAENCVGAEPRLVGGAVERNQSFVDDDLIFRLIAKQSLGDFAVHAFDSRQNALAHVAFGVPVALLDRLMGAGGGSGGNRRAARRAILQRHIDFNGGVSARIQDFAGVDVDDFGHLGLYWCGAASRRLDRPIARFGKVSIGEGWPQYPGSKAWLSVIASRDVPGVPAARLLTAERERLLFPS